MKLWLNSKDLHRSSQGRIADFLRTQIQTGIVFCDLAKTCPALERRVKRVKLAEKALDVANEWMWRIQIEHEQFDQLSSELDLLRLKIQDVKNQSETRGS